jgi:hypothetical protein
MKKKYNKKIRNATATTFNGIKFKSKLEKFTYQCLKVAGIPFNYEKDRFILIDKFIYKGESIEKKKSKGKNVFVKASKNISQATYLPDFTNLDQGWIIECKGLRTEAFNLRWKLFKSSLAKQKKNYDLYMPGTQKQIMEVINSIKEKTMISNEDKEKLNKKIRRDSQLEAEQNGMDLRSKPYKNKKKYTRKNKHAKDSF